MSNFKLTTVIEQSEHLKAFISAARGLLDSYDLTKLLVYIIDTAPESVLPYLASQFQVLGAAGWQYADTSQKQRDLLKRALELNRYKGTVWAIKEGLVLGGFSNITITEGVATGGSLLYNATALFDSTNTYDNYSNQWPFFSVSAELNGQPNNSETLAKATAIINQYKNARSTLVAVNLS